MIFDLAAAKQHLRIEHGDEDAYVTALCEAAEQQFNNYTGRVLYERQSNLAEAPENALNLSSDIEAGAWVLIGALYENREHGDGLPLPTKLLWDPYRWLAV
ncbi:head-tail connector protein [Microbulbifer discodermiae]|uniref:head-tail connector protein n=1 Tax=Microbulbifer sp. 2201CG32-9 TaxID=3232309 RepID=UPI00345C1CDD